MDVTFIPRRQSVFRTATSLALPALLALPVQSEEIPLEKNIVTSIGITLIILVDREKTGLTASVFICNGLWHFPVIC